MFNETIPYDSENVFSKIIKGKISSVPLYEDCDILAFMDAMPQSPGHSLVIPKSPSRNLLDADPSILKKLIVVVHKIAKATQKGLHAEGIKIMQFNEPLAGQTIFHLHFHIIPCFPDQKIRPHEHQIVNMKKLEQIAQKIRAFL